MDDFKQKLGSITEAFAPELPEWQVLVGQAILYFGEIELISIKCLSTIPSESMSQIAPKLEFTKRVDLLLEILEARLHKAPAYILAEGSLLKLINGLGRARKLVDTRNLIAHNPAMLMVYISGAEDKISAERKIQSARNENKTMGLMDLKAFVDEVENLAKELWGNFSGVAVNLDRNGQFNPEPHS